jgi:hypothetical protein
MIWTEENIGIHFHTFQNGRKCYTLLRVPYRKTGGLNICLQLGAILSLQAGFVRLRVRPKTNF